MWLCNSLRSTGSLIRSAIPTFTQQFLSRSALALILFRDLSCFDNISREELHKELKHVNIARILDAIVCQLNGIAIVKEGDSWIWDMTFECTTGSNAPTRSTSSLECQNQTQDYIYLPQITSKKYNMAVFIKNTRYVCDGVFAPVSMYYVCLMMNEV